MPLTPTQRRWVLIIVVYDAAKATHMNAFRDGIIAAVATKLFDGKIKRN